MKKKTKAILYLSAFVAFMVVLGILAHRESIKEEELLKQKRKNVNYWLSA